MRPSRPVHGGEDDGEHNWDNDEDEDDEDEDNEDGEMIPEQACSWPEGSLLQFSNVLNH